MTVLGGRNAVKLNRGRKDIRGNSYITLEYVWRLFLKHGFSKFFSKFCSLLTAIFLSFGAQHLLFIFYSVIQSYYYELFVFGCLFILYGLESFAKC